MSITSLGYLGFRVSDPGAWENFAVHVLGLMSVTSPGGAQRFRNDAHDWRIAIQEGSEDDLAYVGFEVRGAGDLEAVRQRLIVAGHEVIDGDQTRRRERGVLGLITTCDPGGLTVEIYYGPTVTNETPFRSPSGANFVTGDQGLGHIVLAHPDIDAMRSFYTDALGFSLSDIIRMEVAPDFGVDLEFFHCNRRHHTLALVPVPAAKRLHHFMLETESLDDVGFALDRATATGAGITQTLGRHTNDHMVSFYAATPSGFQVEYGWGAREVDASWRVVRHQKISIWGHKMVGHTA
jgi:biphenyl-2,3-diol 1,2-dioxygenase